MRISKTPIIGAVVMTLILGGLAVVTSDVAGATGTTLVTESFANGTLAQPSAWSLPTGSAGVCLTAGTNTSATPVPDCQSSGGDTSGSGALQLTNNAGGAVGTIYSNTILPTANGLDVSWDSYQFNGSGADGISFDLAAVNPSNPVPPTTTGPSGGSLGYAATSPTTSSPSTVATNGVPYGYMGFGADVFGNYENSAGGFGGTACSDTTSVATPESMGVRGPGNGTTGYCLLAQDNLSGSKLDNSTATVRSPSIAVQEEVVLNTSTSPVTATTSGVSVLAGHWLFATLPIGAGGVWQSLTGVLPASPTGVPAGWLNSTSLLPQELAFGWASSTGGETEFHQINTLQALTLSAAPILSMTNTDSGSGTLYANTTNSTVTLTAGVSSSSTVTETQPVTISDTFPSGLTPTAATGSNWTCTITGQNVSCTSPASTIAIGGTLPPVTVTVSTSSTPNNLTNTANATSSDGAAASASDSINVLPQLPQAITFTNTPPSPAYVGATYTVTTNGGGASGNAVVFTKDGASTSGCTVNSVTGMVTLSASAGTCVVDANQAAGGIYAAAPQVQQTVTSVLNPQVITYTNTPPSPAYVGATYIVTTNGGGASGNPVVLSVHGSSTGGCTINPATGVVTLGTSVGTCVIDANQAAGGIYAAAPLAQQSVTTVLNPQVITFTNSQPTNPSANSTYTVTATGGASGNSVTFSKDVSSTSSCTVNASTGVVVLTTPTGTCVVDANQAGNLAYAVATQVQQSVTSIVIPQSVSFTNTPPVNPPVNSTYTVTTSAGSSGNPVVLSVDHSSTGGCTINPSTRVVTLSSPIGTCVIDANQAGDSAHSAAPQVRQSVTSNPIGQVINFTNSPPASAHVNSTYTVTAAGGASGNPVTFSVDKTSTSGCVVNPNLGVVTLSAPAGTCVIDANQAGSTEYLAAVQVSQSASDSQIPQVVTFDKAAPTDQKIGATYVATASGGASGNPVTFSKGSSSTSGCTVSSTGLVTYNAPTGTCVVEANQAGNGAYSAAVQATQESNSVKIPVVLHFKNLPTPTPTTGSVYRVTVTSSGSVQQIVFSKGSASTSGCVVSKTGVVTFKAPAGTCVVRATQAGSAKYLPASYVAKIFHVKSKATKPVAVPKKPVTYPASASTIVFYPNDSWQLTTTDQQIVAKFAITIKNDHLQRVVIDGYASSTGPFPNNTFLGDQRANVAATYLLHRLKELGYKGLVVVSAGHGATRFLVLPSDSPQNRRTVFAASR